MKERPLSPHIQIYRLPLTALVSITHRATGAMLTLGLIVLASTLMKASEGMDGFNEVHRFWNAWYGHLILWSWLFSLSFHFCHGIRHLIWDIGFSFQKEMLNQLAVIEILAAITLTFAALFLT